MNGLISKFFGNLQTRINWKKQSFPITLPENIEATKLSSKEPMPIQFSQKCDLSFTKEPSQHGEIGYLFSRSADSFLYDTEGQDYFVFHDGIDNFCFVVCDGVGQSYFGQLAAAFLGEHLLTWLKNLDSEMLHDPNLAEQLSVYLNGLISSAQEMVIQHQLPTNLPNLQLMALTEQKNYGSEAVFVAGRVDFNSGTKDQSHLLNLFWLGDAQFHFYDFKGNEFDFPGKWKNSERWSTKHGIKGADKVNHWVDKRPGVGKLVAHSDGIKSRAAELFDLTNKSEEMNSVVQSLRSSPESDDISLIVFDFITQEKNPIRKMFSHRTVSKNLKK